MTQLPAVFLSHGAPTLLFDGSPAHRFLRSAHRLLERPTGVLVMSAHWESPDPLVTGAARPVTIHDFRGWPAPLYDVEYPAPGDPALAEAAAGLLRDYDPVVDRERGLDHGAWIPLALMYPDADVPVLQVSVPTQGGAERAFQLGRALAPLRDEGVLLLGSGGITHNLRRLTPDVAAEPRPEAREFADRVADCIRRGDDDALCRHAEEPASALVHPTPEHYFPLLFAAGAGGWPAKPLHRSFSHAALAMDAYAFGV